MALCSEKRKLGMPFSSPAPAQCWFKLPASEDRVKPVTARRGTGEQIGFLGAARTSRHQFAGVPEDRITVGNFVHWEVALEHAARCTEGLDDSLDVGAKFSGYHLR